MVLTQTEQYMWADRILRAVCLVGEIPFTELVSERRSDKTDKLRGLYCLLTRDLGVHPDRAARLISRTRQNIINQAKRYAQHVQVHDREITMLYSKIKENLKQYDDNEKRL